MARTRKTSREALDEKIKRAEETLIHRPGFGMDWNHVKYRAE